MVTFSALYCTNSSDDYKWWFLVLIPWMGWLLLTYNCYFGPSQREFQWYINLSVHDLWGCGPHKSPKWWNSSHRNTWVGCVSPLKATWWFISLCSLVASGISTVYKNWQATCNHCGQMLVPRMPERNPNCWW